MNKEELDKILDAHKKWLNDEKGGERADLHSANLIGADLGRADLRGADLRGADLRGANLSGADLSYANLSYANLYGTDLDDKEKCRLGIILKEDKIGYKKLCRDIICKILIPKYSIVFSINNSKCRTNKCIVLENSGISQHDINFKYEVGEQIEIDDFNLQYNVECGTGIHFFWTEEEAKNY
jgi:hypothetical protein